MPRPARRGRAGCLRRRARAGPPRRGRARRARRRRRPPSPGRGRHARRSARRARRRRGRPARALRVSLCTRAICVVALPTTRAPGSMRAASSSVIMAVELAAVAAPAAAVRAASAFPACAASENGTPGAGDLLVVLVALAGDQDDVGRRGAADRVADRLGAVLDDVDLVVADRAGEDLRQDQVRRLEPRVVAGDDDAAGQPARDRAHQRPLGGVAVAAAAEHAPERAAARLGERRAARRAPSRARRACARSRRRPRARCRRARRPAPGHAACGPAPASALRTLSPRRRAKCRGRAARR